MQVASSTSFERRRFCGIDALTPRGTHPYRLSPAIISDAFGGARGTHRFARKPRYPPKRSTGQLATATSHYVAVDCVDVQSLGGAFEIN